MNTVGPIVAVIGGLVIISGFIVAVWVSARAKGQEEVITRTRADRDDYLSRLQFLEPRLAKALEENTLLQELHNPTAAMTDIKADTAKIRVDVATALALLRAQAVDLTEAQERAHLEGEG